MPVRLEPLVNQAAQPEIHVAIGNLRQPQRVLPKHARGNRGPHTHASNPPESNHARSAESAPALDENGVNRSRSAGVFADPLAKSHGPPEGSMFAIHPPR